MYYVFSLQSGHRVVRCNDCGFMTLNPQPSDQELGEIYSKDYFLLERNETGEAHFHELKQRTADHYLDLIERYRGTSKAHGQLLEVGCGEGDFLIRAGQRGFKVVGVEYSRHAVDKIQSKIAPFGKVLCGEIDVLNDQEAIFDVCVLSDVIEHVRDPRAFLAKVRRLLKKDGLLFISCPSLSSWSAKFMKERWVEFKPEHIHYFDNKTIQSLLFHAGFEDMICLPAAKTLSFEYVAGHFEKYPVFGFSGFFALAKKLLPRSLSFKPVSIVASGLVVMSRKKDIPKRRKLSVVLPAFNEEKTVGMVLDRLLAKQFDDLDLEVIVVESKSTDCTREIVLGYTKDPRVRVILEDKPSGKGHAVRKGLKQASGDFVLIQDADFEYDIEDYDGLLEPLLSGRESFVLGSRHGGRRWKLRSFQGDPVSSLVFNFGHYLFASLINILFFTRLKDPFTMYKVFRRDALYGLEFSCNRFDFDYEILINLVRKGHNPIEIPVNYRSRSFDEGKKVSFMLDPWTWLMVLARLRLSKIRPLEIAGKLQQEKQLQPEVASESERVATNLNASI